MLASQLVEEPRYVRSVVGVDREKSEASVRLLVRKKDCHVLINAVTVRVSEPAVQNHRVVRALQNVRRLVGPRPKRLGVRAPNHALDVIFA